MKVKKMLLALLALCICSGNTALAQNTAVNCSFEDGDKGTLPHGFKAGKENGAEGTVGIDNTQKHTGKQSLLVNMTSPSGNLNSSIDAVLKPGIYVFRIWAKAEPEQVFRMQICDVRERASDGKGAMGLDCRSNKKDWGKFEMEIEVKDEFPSSVQFSLSGPGRLWIDDIEIVPSDVTSREKANDVEIRQSWQDLEVRNGKIVLNIVKGGKDAALSYVLDGQKTGATSLNLLSKDSPVTIKSFNVMKSAPGAAVAMVEYGLSDASAVKVSYTVKDNFEYVEAETDFAQGGVLFQASMKSEAMLLPDFFAESMVFYPETVPVEAMNIPSDNHLLVNMIDNGNAMLVLLWDSAPKVSEARKGSLFESAILSADAKTRFWIGALAAKGIWYKVTEKLTDKDYTELNWSPPFPAEWKLATFLNRGFHADSPTCESWFLISKQERFIGIGIGFDNHSAWRAWSSDLGDLIYPCYLQDHKAFAKYPVLKLGNPPVFGGEPELIYSVNRPGAQPGVTMPKNAMQKLLSAEINRGLEANGSPKNRYPPTCGVTEEVEKIFYRGESTKEKNNIQEKFVNMNIFVQVMRERIEEYAAWQKKMDEMLNGRKARNPNLAGTVDGINREISRIALAYAAEKDRMKTPDECAALTGKIISLADSDLSDEQKEEKCKEYGRQIRNIGGSQDSTVAKFRAVVKAVRQNSTRKLMAATDPDEKDLLENVRRETGTILNGRFFMEGK